MSRKKNSDDNVKHKSTKEEIEAAVNACYGNPREKITVDIPGIPSGEIDDKCNQQMFQTVPDKIDPNEPCDESHDGCECDVDSKCCSCQKKSEFTENKVEHTELDGFLMDCSMLKINAKQCLEWSNKSFDQSIEDYLRGINKKIFDETQNGGYSTNVTIRVVQRDWVNVSHIMDWYKSRGFEVLNYRINNSPMNMDTGVIEHNFTISWAV